MKSKNQSVVKTIRLSNELDSYLVTESSKTNQTPSSLISFIVSNYKDRYSFVDKLGPVAIQPANLSLLIDAIEERKLNEIGPIMASRVSQYISHVLAPADIQDTLDWCINEFLPAAHWFTCHKSSKGYMITHNIGNKWTTFLASFLRSLVETQAGAKPDISVENEILILKTQRL